MPSRNTGTKTIFLVEDDIELANLTMERLEKEGYRVLHEANGEAASEKIPAEAPDLVILDIMLPGMDGFGVCRTIRPAYKGPVLILTARDSDLDQILGLELGADDFVIKPIRPQVLMARIKALLRRAEPVVEKKAASPVTVGAVMVDPSRREARFEEAPIDLTTVEFDLLWYLVNHAGTVVSRNDIHLELYSTEYDGLDRSIDVYISRLRHKLGDNPSDPRYLKTVRGVGYLFAGDAS